jgi:hypothetical protein
VKKALLSVFGFASLLFGLGGFGITLDELGSGEVVDPILGFVMAAGFIAVGALMVYAARKNYRLSWSIASGVLLAFFGICFVATTVDDLRTGRAEGPVTGLMLGLGFVVAGAVLTRRGHHHHLRILTQERRQRVEARSQSSEITDVNAAWAGHPGGDVAELVGAARGLSADPESRGEMPGH